MQYDDRNRLLRSIVDDVVGTDDTLTDYHYDANGNLIEKNVHTASASKWTSYTYDVSNRLVEASTSDVYQAFRAYYDARTRRIAKIENDGTDITATSFRYDGGTNFQERIGADVVTELVRAGGLGGGIGSVLYSDKTMAPTPGDWEAFLYNAVGHTTVVTDSTGTPTQKNLYEAFGETVIKDGDSDNNRLRNTKERDATLGLDNDGFRYYDPAVGRYIQRDPIGYGDGMNVYAHVTNNPINRVDPQGLSAVPGDFANSEVKAVYDYLNNLRPPAAAPAAVGPPPNAPRMRAQTSAPDAVNLRLSRDAYLAYQAGRSGDADEIQASLQQHFDRSRNIDEHGFWGGMAINTWETAREVAPEVAAAVIAGNGGPGGGTPRTMGMKGPGRRVPAPGGGQKSTNAAAGNVPAGQGISPQGPYSFIEDSSTVGPGKKFTPTQKAKYREANLDANDGQLRSDLSGELLVPGQKHQKGVTPPANEAHVDHVEARSNGGSNSSSNAQIIARHENLDKSDK